MTTTPPNSDALFALAAAPVDRPLDLQEVMMLHEFARGISWWASEHDGEERDELMALAAGIRTLSSRRGATTRGLRAFIGPHLTTMPLVLDWAWERVSKSLDRPEFVDERYATGGSP